VCFAIAVIHVRVCQVTLVIDMKQGINLNIRIATCLDKRLGLLLGST